MNRLYRTRITKCTEKFGWNNVRESSYMTGAGGGILGPGEIGYSIFG
jgi:hypothetical protein